MGCGGPFEGGLPLFSLAVFIVTFVVAMLKSNLEKNPKPNIYMRIKENSIPPCLASQLARVHIENFH